MKMLKTSACVLLIISILSACGTQEGKEDFTRSILVDNSTLADSLDVSDYIDAIEIIPLKETKGNYLGGIDKFFRINGHYIAADLYQTRQVNLFDEHGNFVKTVIRQGHGPNEILQLNDCWINNAGELEIYDYYLKKVFQCDSFYSVRKVVKAKDFCIFHTISKIPRSSMHVGFAGFNGMDPSTSGEPFQIAILDDSLKVISKQLPYKSEFLRINWLSFRDHFFRYEDSLRFIKAYDNYVYDVQPSGLSKRYKIVYSDNPTPENILDEIVADHLNDFKDRNKNPNERAGFFESFATLNGTWLETDKVVYFTSTVSNKFRFVSLLDKEHLTTKSARMFIETKRYKMTLPYFKLYDPAHKEFSGLIDGSNLKKFLAPDSKFYSMVADDPGIQYIVNVKFRT